MSLVAMPVLGIAPALADDTVFASHGAIYEMSLLDVSVDSTVSGVEGRMLFTSRDVCDGWSTEQRFSYLLTLANDDGRGVEISSTYSTFETKDGREFSFSLNNETNGAPESAFRGHAAQGPDGGSVEFDEPEAPPRALPAEALFPTAHSEALIARALAGDRFFAATLFDGTDEVGMSHVSAVIGDRSAPTTDVENPLIGGPVFPISLAFFPLDGADRQASAGEPEFELRLRLQANGVVERMEIDYGDFSVLASLVGLEALETSCD